MHFIKYFAICIFLAVQYSFQDISSSFENIPLSFEEGQLDFASSQELPLPKDFVIVSKDKTKKDFLGKMRSGIKKQNEKAKQFIKSTLKNSSVGKKMKKLKEKMNETFQKDKKKMIRLSKNAKNRLTSLFKGERSSNSKLSKDDNREKRSVFSTARKGIKKAVGLGVDKAKAAFQKLF